MIGRAMVFRGPALLILAALVLPLVAVAHDRPFPVVSDDYCRFILETRRNFLFEGALPGDGKRPTVTAYADAAQRRPWVAEERVAVERWLGALTSRQDLRRFFARIHFQGSRHFYRLGRLVERTEVNPPRFAPDERVDVVASFTYEFEPYNYHAGITFYDRFFRPYVGLTPEENELRKIRDLFHELLHAFDGPHFDYSRHQQFLWMMGWHTPMGPRGYARWEMDGMAPEAVRENLERLNAMALSGRVAEARAEGRRLGRALGLPHIYGALNPAECFAMLGDAILFDPEAPQYIRAEVIAWFRRNVFR